MPHTETLAVIDVDVDDDDLLGRMLAVRNQVDPRPLTVAGFRAEITAAVEHLELLAVQDGRDVGAAAGGWGAILAEASETVLEAWVLPDARRQGIGTALIDRLVALGRRHGMTNGLASAIDGDEASIRFAARYGLTPYSRGQMGHLTLTEAQAGATAKLPDGVELTSLGDRPDLIRAVYDLDVAVQPEIPSLAVRPTPTFEAWDQQVTGDPGFVPSLSVLAIRDERVLGNILIYDNAEGNAFIGMTAVDPGTRRQGIARALKIELARRAVAGGWHRLETFNDGANTRMRALNEQLGYVYQPATVGLKGPLPSG
jgi:GNAT superfamily N-acetyltransferase